MSIKRFTNFKASVNTKQRLDEGVPAGQPDPKRAWTWAELDRYYKRIRN